MNKLYEYGVNNGLMVSREIILDNEGNPGSWVESAQDGQGRLICTTYSDGSQESHIYNRLGLKIKTIDREGQVMLYAYNSQGELLESALDINQDGAINHDGMDRIQASEKGYLTHENIPVSFQENMAWTQDQLDAVQVIFKNYRSLDGKKSWSWDREQRLTTSTDTEEGVTRVERVIAPDGYSLVSTQVAGQQQNGPVLYDLSPSPVAGNLSRTALSEHDHFSRQTLSPLKPVSGGDY